MAGLTLLLRVLANADFDHLNEFASEIIPLVESLILATTVEDLVLELSLDAWTSWATLVQHEEEDDRSPLIDRMDCLAMACGDTSRRQIASHILRRLQRLTCTTNILALRSDDAGPMRKFFLAALRYDSASDRLTAMRGFYHAFDPGMAELEDDPTVHPVTHMAAADYTCITGETEFYALDTTCSDAKRILDLRVEFFDAMRAFCVSRDFHALGEALNGLLVRDPRAVDFSAPSIQRFAGGKNPEEFELPIRTWPDALHQCADVLSACSQAASGHNHRQAANILRLKYYLVCRDLEAVRELASQLIRNGGTSVLWYSYALSHYLDGETLFIVFEALVTLEAYDPQLERSQVPLRRFQVYPGF
ncbi:hypothetical protein AURDEDRAFT_125156 [Auricularia subglabra TFB-10046 SS5]|uniref:Uncharacterized protein n=1 Tax=Auricularia subglabra (strain TFB-10046 / SS5) TaxID=717982 RepID=J0DDQ6_AURST|nr:hypothetical protein AURDEDRAFT_125156 [Auricularia subglabra TFB-10046 SS5]